MQLIWTGFILGLAGSMHCILMCGPLAAGLQALGPGKKRAHIKNFLYHGGRMMSYLMIGLLFGSAGKLISLIFYQQLLSIVSGALLLLWALFYIFQGISGSGRILRVWTRAASGLFSVLRKQKTMSSIIGLGMLNGFLPCGMVYLAATASLNNGTPGYSVLYMLLFGLGTLPAMTGIIMARNFLPSAWKFSLRKLSPVFFMLLGVLFVLRGLNLDIPYISPHITQNTNRGEINNCCSKPDVMLKN
jgi:uncharacterized protein